MAAEHHLGFFPAAGARGQGTIAAAAVATEGQTTNNDTCSTPVLLKTLNHRSMKIHEVAVLVNVYDTEREQSFRGLIPDQHAAACRNCGSATRRRQAGVTTRLPGPPQLRTRFQRAPRRCPERLLSGTIARPDQLELLSPNNQPVTRDAPSDRAHGSAWSRRHR